MENVLVLIKHRHCIGYKIIHNREGETLTYLNSNPREDKGNNHVPPNCRTRQQKSLTRSTPQANHEYTRENLEIPPQLCPSIPTVIFLPHTYSTVLITARQFYFQHAPLASHSIQNVHNNKRAHKSFSQRTWQCPASSHMLFIHFYLGLFPPLVIFTDFLNP